MPGHSFIETHYQITHFTEDCPAGDLNSIPSAFRYSEADKLEYEWCKTHTCDENIIDWFSPATLERVNRLDSYLNSLDVSNIYDPVLLTAEENLFL